MPRWVLWHVLQHASPASITQDMGNSHLAMGQKLKKAFYMRESIRQYNTALAEPFDNPSLRSILHSNRAQAESLLGNWGNALRDATTALRFDPDNLKVVFTVIRALLLE